MAQTRKRKATVASAPSDAGEGASRAAEGHAGESASLAPESPPPIEINDGAPGGQADGGPAPEGPSRASGRRRVMEDVARRRAAHFARFDSDQAAAPIPDTGALSPLGADDKSSSQAREDPAREAWCGPFATARQLVEGRDAALAERQATSTSASQGAAVTVSWTPKPRTSVMPGVGGGLDCPPVKPATKVPSLLDMCIELICKYLDAVESLEGLPEVALQRLTRAMCEKRLLTSHVLKLLAGPSMSELVWPDCTLLGEAELTAALSQCVGGRLQRLDLGFCGRGLSDRGITATLGSSPGCLPQLRALFLRGAYRVTDAGLAAAVLGAPNVTSIGITDNAHVTGRGLESMARAPAGATDTPLSRTNLCQSDHHTPSAGKRAGFQHENGVRPGQAGAMAAAPAASTRCIPSSLTGCIGPRITELVLDGCTALRPTCLASSIALMPAIERLSLRGVLAGVTNASLQEVAVSLGRNLRHLDIADCGNVTDAGVQALAACCPSLAHLDLGGLDRITGASLASLGSGCRVLQSVVLRRCRGILMADLCEFIKNRGTNLRHLSLNSLPK
eukprot:jgi/Mesvir1/10684/Mv13775-RA.1